MKILPLLLVLATPSFAQTFVAPLPDSTAMETVSGTFPGAGGTTLAFDLFRPRGVQAALPVVVVFNLNGPNGRTMSLNRHWAQAFAGAGLAGIVYESRTASADADFDAILAHLLAHGGELGVDGTRAAVWAGSSNASRALPLAMDPSRRRVRAVVACYGFGVVPAFRPDVPVLFVRAGLDAPRVLSVQDSLIARALAQNAPVSVINLPHGTHPFEESVDDPAARGAIARTLSFLTDALGPGLADALEAGAGKAAANAALAAGDFATAVTRYEALVTAQPDDYDLVQRVGDSKLAARDYVGAAAAYERSLKLGSWRKGELAMGAIAAYAHAGTIDKARPWLDRLAPMWTNEVVLARLGDVGKRDDVRKLFESRVVPK